MSGLNNVIQWADAVEALKVIADEQKLVSGGMTIAEVAAALKYTKGAGGMYLKTVMSTVASSAAGATATEVIAATTSQAATTTAVNLTLVEGTGAAAGTVQVAGIGSIALPIVACIAAAAGGYLIGKELDKNEAYHSFWDNLVFNTCDFVTGRNLINELIYDEQNAPTVPLLYDANGNTYLQYSMTSAIKNYLDSMSANGTISVSELLALYGITPTVNHANFTNALIFEEAGYSGTLGHPVLWLWLTNGDFYQNGTALSSTDISTFEGWYLDTKTRAVYTGKNANDTVFTNFGYSRNLALYCVKTFTAAGRTTLPNLTMLYIDPSTMLPPDVTKYIPAINSITSIVDPNGNQWSHVVLPSTNPLEMPDGEPVTDEPSVPERLTPFIKPWQPQPNGVPLVIPATTPVNPIILPNPEPDTSTAPYPKPNPAVDPSQLAEPLPVSEPADPIPNPVNTGKPIIPVVPPALSPSSAKGLLHVYNPTPTQVDLFGEWLWTTFSGDLIDTIGKLFNNPMDAVIGLHEIYCTPTESGADVNIRAGFLESNVPSRLVTSRYIEIKCGALSVPEYWGNYLDYSPYTKSYCYLPFIGIVELNADDIVGSGVEITYRIDVYNGSCIALITTAKPNSDECISYQFEGNCSVAVPITSGMMTAVQNGLMGIATTALSAATTAAITVATGGTALPAAVMVGTVAAGATQHGLTSKNQVQLSGSFGSSFGAMGVKIPFLIIKRPRQKVVHGYNTNYGYPSHKMVLISTCSGYLRAIEVDVVSPTATEAEKKMIEQLLKSGVFVD